jgi:hypothetical protein
LSSTKRKVKSATHKMKLSKYWSLNIWLDEILENLNYPLLSVSFLIDWMGEWLLFNANSSIFHLYYGENKLIFNEMMMRSALYYTNMLSWSLYMGHFIFYNQPCYGTLPSRVLFYMWRYKREFVDPLFAWSLNVFLKSFNAINTI